MKVPASSSPCPNIEHDSPALLNFKAMTDNVLHVNPVNNGNLYLPPRNLMRAWQHGSSVVDVHVSDSSSSKTFTIHRNLLIYNSDVLSSLLSSATTTTITLKGLCPQAFEVAYQYLYAGHVFDEVFYKPFSTAPSDLFWLRAFKLAHELHIYPLAAEILSHIENVLFFPYIPPSTQFIREIYAPESCEFLSPVRERIESWTAENLKWKNPDTLRTAQLSELFQSHPQFATAVACLTAKTPTSLFGPAHRPHNRRKRYTSQRLETDSDDDSNSSDSDVEVVIDRTHKRRNRRERSRSPVRVHFPRPPVSPPFSHRTAPAFRDPDADAGVHFEPTGRPRDSIRPRSTVDPYADAHPLDYAEFTPEARDDDLISPPHLRSMNQQIYNLEYQLQTLRKSFADQLTMAEGGDARRF